MPSGPVGYAYSAASAVEAGQCAAFFLPHERHEDRVRERHHGAPAQRDERHGRDDGGLGGEQAGEEEPSPYTHSERRITGRWPYLSPSLPATASPARMIVPAAMP